MKALKEKIEKMFERLASLVFRRHWFFLAILLGVQLTLGYFALGLRVDTSFESMLHKDDPSRVKYGEFRKEFGRDELTIVTIKAKDTVFTQEGLEILKTMHENLEKGVPYLDKVTSLVNVRNVRSIGDTLKVDKFLDDWFQGKATLEEIRYAALKNQLYRNHYMSENGRAVAIIVETQDYISKIEKTDDALSGFDDESTGDTTEPTIEFLGEKEKIEIALAVKRIVAKYQYVPGFTITATGHPIVEYDYKEIVQVDSGTVTLLSIIMTILFLALLFGTARGVLFPILIVMTTVISTLGFMAIFNVPFSITTLILPSFIIVVGIADVVHILSDFYQYRKAHQNNEKAIVMAMGHTGLPVFLTTLTTSIGLISFCFNDLTIISDLGIFASLGAVLALLYTLLTLPALIAVFPVKSLKVKERKRSLADGFLNWCFIFSTSHPRKIVMVGVMLMAVSVTMLFRLEFHLDLVSYFPEDHDTRIGIESLDENFNGSIALEVEIDTGEADSLKDPAILKKMERLIQDALAMSSGGAYIGKAISMIDILKETHKALNEGSWEYYRIPDTQEKVAQEILLFEGGSDDLERLVDSQYTKARITFKVPFTDVVEIKGLVDMIQVRADEIFADTAMVSITGTGALMARVVTASLKNIAKSYIMAFVVIMIVMIILVGDLRLGFLSMFPNILPIVMVMGLMGILYIALDIDNLLIGCIAIGIIVDDTMHFMYNFQKYYRKYKNSKMAIQATFEHVGKALLITTVVLSSGFFVQMTATLSNIVCFGFFTGLIIVVALLVDFILLPAILILAVKSK